MTHLVIYLFIHKHLLCNYWYHTLRIWKETFPHLRSPSETGEFSNGGATVEGVCGYSGDITVCRVSLGQTGLRLPRSHPQASGRKLWGTGALVMAVDVLWCGTGSRVWLQLAALGWAMSFLLLPQGPQLEVRLLLALGRLEVSRPRLDLAHMVFSEWANKAN